MTLKYPVKHWLTSLVIGPAFIITYDAMDHSALMNNAIEIYFLGIAYGIPFSIPTFILYTWIYTLLIKTNYSDWIIKSILNIVGVVGIIITFFTIGGSLTLTESTVYSIALIAGSFFYKVRPIDHTGSNLTSNSQATSELIK